MKRLKQIQSKQNQTYKDWRKLLRRKGREKTGLYLIEGTHLVIEALKEPNAVSAIIYDEDFEKQDTFSNHDAHHYLRFQQSKRKNHIVLHHFLRELCLQVMYQQAAHLLP